MITAEDITGHLPHQVKDAPHLVVCACAELFYADGGQPAMAVWAAHLTEALNVALTGTRGPA